MILSSIIGDGSLPVQDIKPSPRPGLEQPVPPVLSANAAQVLGNYHREIVLDDFGIGSAIKMTYLAPTKGRVSLNLMDEVEKDIVLHVDARYDWYSSVKQLVLNAYEAGVGWGSELKPAGFDFTAGILVTTRVEAEADRFIIYCNDREVGQFEYRLPVTSVKKVQVIFEDNNAEQKAEFRSLAVHFR